MRMLIMSGLLPRAVPERGRAAEHHRVALERDGLAALAGDLAQFLGRLAAQFLNVERDGEFQGGVQHAHAAARSTRLRAAYLARAASSCGSLVS